MAHFRASGAAAGVLTAAGAPSPRRWSSYTEAHSKARRRAAANIVAELHESRRTVYPGEMSSQRLNITLDEAHAAKLSRLAARVHVNEGTLARSLLSTAIDDADPDAANLMAVLDGIEGAWERAQLGSLQAGTGETIALDDL